MLATDCYRLLAELRALLNDEHELLVGCEPPSSFGPSVSDRHTRPSADSRVSSMHNSDSSSKRAHLPQTYRHCVLRRIAGYRPPIFKPNVEPMKA